MRRIPCLIFLALAFNTPLAAVSLDELQTALDAGDVARALPALRRAADSGDPRGIRMLAELYQRGEGVDKDPNQAIKLYRQASELGDSEAQFNLGNIYLLGEGIAADEVWALTYYRQAAAQGHELASRNMQQLYRAAGLEPPSTQVNSVATPDPAVVERAHSEPVVAAVPAVEIAALAPTTRLTDGRVPKQKATIAHHVTPEKIPEEAGTARTASAATNNPSIEIEPVEEPTDTRASIAHEISDDEREAIRLAREHGVEVALDRDSVSSSEFEPASSAGALAGVGSATDRDELSVRATIALHVDSDDAAALYESARLRLASHAASADIEIAIKLLENAARAGHSEAQYELGKRYLNGAGVLPDDAMAVTLFRDAARNGHAGALRQLESIYAAAGLPLPELRRPRAQVAPQTRNDAATAAANVASAAQAMPPAANILGAAAVARTGAGGSSVEPAADAEIAAPAAATESTHAHLTAATPTASVAATNSGAPEAASTSDNAGSSVEKADIAASYIATAEVTTAEVEAAAGQAVSRPAPVAQQPYRAEPYEYAVIDHEATPLPHVELADIEPAKPLDHVVVPGSLLVQASGANSTVAESEPMSGLSEEEMAVVAPDENLDDVVTELPGADRVEPPQSPGVTAAADTPDANSGAAEWVPAATVAAVSAVPPAELQSAINNEAGARAALLEPAVDPEMSSFEEVKTVAVASIPVVAEAATAADPASAVVAAAVVAAKPEGSPGFFGRLRDALSNDDDEPQTLATRAPVSGGQSPLAGPAAAGQERARKLAIAEPAEPSPVIEKPTIEQATAALNAGDFERAAGAFTVLAEAGNAEAQAHIGYMTYQGEGVSRDKAAAVEWYRRSAVQGNRDAQYNLAVAYAFGEGVPQDDSEAVIWYRRAAEQASAIAQYSLAVSYALGEGVAQSDVDAARWYQAAAAQGYPAAQYNLAYMYRTGNGVEQSDSDALRWFLQAARNGHASAQYSLGYMYRSGKGVARDIDEAVRWYRLAAGQGHPEARADLASLAPDS